jgi:tRNA dimethylallyltransferase
MIDGGAVDEAAALSARDLPADAPVLRAIGVRALADFAAGRLDRDAARDALATETRQYAKRQYTWFRHQPPSSWSRVEDYDDRAVAEETFLLFA